MTKGQRRRNMRRFQMMEISAVDKPAQEGALAMLMKRRRDDETTVQKQAPLALQIVKRFLDDGDVAAFMRLEVTKRAGNIEKADEVRPYFGALQTSLTSIVKDNSLSDGKRIHLMKSSAEDFIAAAKTKLPGIEAHLLKALNEGDMNLNQLKKQMDELSKRVDGIAPKLDLIVRKLGSGHIRKGDDDEGDEEAAAARLSALLGKNTMEGYEGEEEFTGKADDDMPFMEDEEDDMEKGEDPEPEKPTSEGEEDETIGAGSPTPIGGGKRASGTTVKRIRASDDVITVGDRRVHKAAIGPDMFAILKGQQAEMDELRKRADEAQAAREMAEFTKVADDQLRNLPGTSEQKARILKQLGGALGKEDRLLLSKMLKAGDGAMVSAFKTVGHRDGSGEVVGKAASDFTKRVNEVRTRDGCSRQEAMTKARNEYPEEYAAYQGN